jgi:hypothetical protein
MAVGTEMETVDAGFRTGHGDLDAAEMDVTHASAVEDDTEETSISLRAMPLVAALVHTFETAGLWTQAMRCAWQSWFAAARGFAQPRALESPPPSDGTSRSAEGRGSRIRSARRYQCVGQLRTERNHV